MAVTFSLGFDPIWSNFNLTGIAAGGAQLTSVDSNNPNSQKPIFSDPAGQFPYPNPILFDENGNAPGPFYFKLDSSNPSSLYDLFLYDTNDNLIWNVNGYFPSGGSGGSIVTTNNIQNLIVNSTFWDNLAGINYAPLGSATIPIIANKTRIAPGLHDALSFNENSFVLPNAYYGPDIWLIKTNTTATETFSFVLFTTGTTPFAPSDVTPIGYVNHTTTSAGTSEAYKYYQIPITAKVQNLSNQPVTITIWAQGISGNQTLSIQVAQFFGDGAGASTTVLAAPTVLTLTNAWTKYQIQMTIPSVAGKTLGTAHNDGTFLHIGIPLTSICSINFAVPRLYLGSISPGADFQNYDVIDSTIHIPRTGDTRTSLNSFSPFGWVPMNDGTIGNIGSGATTRANLDTFPLYNLIWTSVDRMWAPLSAASTGSAIGDFAAGTTLALTKSLGRVFAGTNPPTFVLGQFLGADTHLLTTNELAQHTHDVPAGFGAYVTNGGGGAALGGGDGIGFTAAVTGGVHGLAQTALSLDQPTTYMNVFVKL